MASKINIFFDEKGPTKTIKANEGATTKEKFNYQSSDNVPAYCGIYITIDGDKQNEFDQGYLQIEENFRKKYPQIAEIKGKNLFKKVNTLQVISTRAKTFLIELLNLLKKVDAHVQLSVFDKSSVMVATRLKQWLFDLETNTKLNRDSQISIPSVIYSVVKYLRTEDQDKEFLLALNNESLSTYQILSVLKNGLNKFIDEHKNIPRTEVQCENYKKLIHIINVSNKNGNDHGTAFRFPVEHLPYGLNLFILAADQNPADCTIYLDDDAPIDGYSSQDFQQVKGGLDSKDFPGLRAADILAVLFGDLLLSFDKDMHYNEAHPEIQKLLPDSYFKEMSDSQLLEIVDTLNELIFESTNHYAIVHSEFADYVYALMAWFRLGAAKNNISFNPEEHLKATLDLMKQNYQQMAKQSYLIQQCGFKTSKHAIEAGVLKPFF